MNERVEKSRICDRQGVAPVTTGAVIVECVTRRRGSRPSVSSAWMRVRNGQIVDDTTVHGGDRCAGGLAHVVVDSLRVRFATSTTGLDILSTTGSAFFPTGSSTKPNNSAYSSASRAHG
jgi:hypothetical protein